MLEQQMQ